ncbi:MAG: DUF1311 domain-containing protein [bacterium]|nr:DUF1311 domain-containing protein [bacterium]
MSKRLSALLTAGCMILSVCGCGKADAEKSEVPTIPIIIEDDEANAFDANIGGIGVDDVDAAGADGDNADGAALSFADFHYLTFDFSSGAGAWATELSIRADGTFAGEYHDDDMGDTGDDHPYGTAYHCAFNGQFSQPVKVNDYTYSMQILSISYADEPGTEAIRDGVLYYYTTPYGLDDAKDILVYLPGAPLAELPEGYRSWVGYYYLENTTDTELPFYGLYNEAAAEGFSSYAAAEAFASYLASIANMAAALEDDIAHDAALSQADLNVKAGELYEMWDFALNQVWNVLKRVNDAETMRALTDEQLAWIAEKEAAVEAAGTEFEGGSLYPLVTNTKAAELTKARVYELLAMLDA